MQIKEYWLITISCISVGLSLSTPVLSAQSRQTMLLRGLINSSAECDVEPVRLSLDKDRLNPNISLYEINKGRFPEMGDLSIISTPLHEAVAATISASDEMLPMVAMLKNIKINLENSMRDYPGVSVPGLVNSLRDQQEKVDRLRSKYQACLATVDLLFKGKANVNYYGQASLPPLFTAVAKGNQEMFDFLLGKGANPKIKIVRKKVPFSAPMANNQSMLIWLVDSGLKISGSAMNLDSAMRFKLGYKPEVGRHDDVEFAEFIMRVIALSDVDATDDSGCTALWYAVKQGQFGMSASLLHGGANPNKINKNGVSPFDVAREGGNKELIGLIMKYVNQ